MSQGDYIKYKRVGHVLNEPAKLNSTLGSREYTQFKEYSLENTIQSEVRRYDKWINPATTRIIFDMELRNRENCPEIQFCTNTNTRANRVLNMAFGSNYTPKPSRPIALKTVKDQHPEKVGILNHPNCKCLDD